MKRRSWMGFSQLVCLAVAIGLGALSCADDEANPSSTDRDTGVVDQDGGTSSDGDTSLDGDTPSDGGGADGAGNLPPRIDEVSLPAVIRGNDDVSVEVVVDDPEGDDVALAYKWTVNASVVDETGDTLSGVIHFDKGDVIEVEVVARDGTGEARAKSSPVTVSNTPPEAPAVSVEPRSPSPGDDLVCVVTTAAVDADGDEVTYAMTWTVDGASYAAPGKTTWDGDSVAGSDVEDGQRWSCAAVASDGEDEGPAVSAEVAVCADRVRRDSGQSLGGDASYGVELGDLDGDGDLDAIFANYEQPNRVYLNDGSGNFTDSRQLLGAAESLDVALGDVDGDGDLDAVFANAEEDNALYLNDGAARFLASSQSLGSASSRAIALGDIDADGDLDAVVANNDAASEVFLNAGDGTFLDSAQRFGAVGSEDVVMGDVDGDSDLDVLVAGRQLRLFRNSGRGTFPSTGEVFFGGSLVVPAAILIDFDSDGDLDMVDGRSLLVNEGDLGFVNAGVQLQASTMFAAAVADFDGDGDDDFVAANGTQPSRLYFSAEDGFPRDEREDLAAIGSSGVAVGDVDADRDIDIVFANNDRGNRVFLSSCR